MADPVSIMAVTSMGLSAAGAGVSMFGAARKDDATAAMYNYKAAVAQANQRVAAQNAQQAIQEGGVQAQFAGLRGAQEYGHLIGAQAASGLQLGTGSAGRVAASQRAGIQRYALAASLAVASRERESARSEPTTSPARGQ